LTTNLGHVINILAYFKVHLFSLLKSVAIEAQISWIFAVLIYCNFSINTLRNLVTWTSDILTFELWHVMPLQYSTTVPVSWKSVEWTRSYGVENCRLPLTWPYTTAFDDSGHQTLWHNHPLHQISANSHYATKCRCFKFQDAAPTF